MLQVRLCHSKRFILGRAIKIACEDGDADACKYYKNLDAYVDVNDTETLEMLVFQYVKEPFGDFDKVPMEDVHDETIEGAFDELMGQFAENDSELEEGYMKGYQKYHCEDCGCQMHNCKPPDAPRPHDETGSGGKMLMVRVPDVMEQMKRTNTHRNLFLYDRHTDSFQRRNSSTYSY